MHFRPKGIKLFEGFIKIYLIYKRDNFNVQKCAWVYNNFNLFSLMLQRAWHSPCSGTEGRTSEGHGYLFSGNPLLLMA